MIALMGFNANAEMYIVGQAPFGDWEPDKGVEMTYENGIYTYNATLSGSVWFVFGTQRDADWDIFNANYRIGPVDGDMTVEEGVEYNTQFAAGNNGAYNFKGTGDEYTITFDEENMKFKIEAKVHRGDVNGDNYVNISDVTALINYLLSHNASGINLDIADCNKDGNINISDVTALINFLLSHKWPVPEMVYTIVGVESVFGTNWDPNDNNNNMVKGANGIYTWSKTGVALTGNFEFKIVGNHDWAAYEWPIGEGNNIVVNVAEEGIYTIDITFNPDADEANRVTYTLTKTGDIEHVYTVVGTPNLFEADWDLNYPGNEMVKGEDGIYRLNKAGWFQEGADIRFKVVQDHSYEHSWPAEDFAIGVYKTGAFNYEIVFNPYNNDEDKVHVIITEIF